ncbi:MAG: TolC family protein [Candidatus Amulumruptor sp.]|nr:TolC family protein [Candidatus Amulumruptor sp.]
MPSHFIKGLAPAALAVLVSVTAAAREATQADTLVLSLDSCIAIALDANPTIKVADLEVKRIDLTKKSTIAQLLPNVSFGAQYSRTLAKQTMYMSMDGFGGEGNGSEAETQASGSSNRDNGIKVGLDNSWSLGFNGSLPIIAPQLWATLRLNDEQILASVESARSSRLDMIKEVKNAYYGMMLADDSYRVVRDNYDMALYTAAQYRRRFEIGTASRYDTLRTSVAVKNIEPQLTQAEIAIRQSRLLLAMLMGIDTAPFITPATRLADYEATMYADVLAIDPSIGDNTDLRLLDIQRRQAEQAVKVNKLAFVPTLALTANYNWTSMSNGKLFGAGDRWSPYSSVGLALSVPLFEGGGRYNSVKQSKIQARELDLQRDNLRRSIQMQVDVAMDNIQLNVKQIASSGESVRQAEDAYRIICESFELGTASYLDRRDSELQLTQSRLAYLQAIYNYLTARADLENLLGTAYPSHNTTR